MDKIRSAFASLAAATVEQELLKITVPEGHRYNYKQIGFNLADDCTVKVYFEDEHVITYQRDGDESTDRFPINWEMRGGDEMRVVGSNATGGALDVGVTVEYDDVGA